MQEKRIYFRHTSRFFREFKVELRADSSQEVIAAKILNASDGGVLVSIENRFQLGEIKSLLLDIYGVEEELILSRNVEVAWISHHPTEGNSSLIGLMFTDEGFLPNQIFAQSIAENDSEALLALG